EAGNMTLVNGNKKVQVSKEFLSMHSPVFTKMFYGDFAIKGKKKVEIKEVEYEEFLDILSFLFALALPV
ncbi:hypothetical protein PENTCL1PPCAC_11115, partial [Pristionchus entomophagus]